MNNADYLPDDLAAIHTYDDVALWCAKRGLTGKMGDPLPNLLSEDIVKLINDDPDAFQDRVKQCAYALAMDKTNKLCPSCSINNHHKHVAEYLSRENHVTICQCNSCKK